MRPFDEISVRLSTLSGEFRRRFLMETASWCLAGFFFAFGLAVILAQLGWTRAGLTTVAAGVLAAVVMWLYLARQRSHQLQVAYGQAGPRLAEGLAPELGSSASSAVDLARRMNEDAPFSKDLAEEHLRRTATTLRGLNLEERLEDSRRQRKRWSRAGLAVMALWAVLLATWLEHGRRRLSTMILDPGAARISDVPLAGDITITYEYPAYTGLQKRVVEGGDGSISAVTGTEVSISAISDVPAREAVLILQSGEEHQEIRLAVVDGRKLSGSLSILRDGRYRFALVDDDGDRVEERTTHSVRAQPDNYPEVHMDQPTTDVELKDDQKVDIMWRARDDFGMAEVSLVVEPDGAEDPIRIPLSTIEEADKRREGRYSWAVYELGLTAGTEARFYIEGVDNDTVSGPKKATSAVRRLVLFSARRNHEDVIAKQQEVMNGLVDWLAQDLVAPFPTRGDASRVPDALATQDAIIAAMAKIEGTLTVLMDALREDKLSKPEVATAFGNIHEHVSNARGKRTQRKTASAKPGASWAVHSYLFAEQQRAIKQLETDTIYLDDLLAIQRIDELKETAKDLLAAQRDLQSLLQEFKDSQDPAVRAQLEQQIRQMREKMLELLSRMSQIKQQLPGEYRNMEAASMLQLDDQLERLEKMLKEGDLDSAAAELEQLANMIENMMDSINRAEDEYGGERYAEVRKQLQDFAQEFEQLENQQSALAKRTDELLREYRKRAVQRAGRDMDNFVKKARQKTAKALEELDKVSEAPGLWGRTQRELDNTRQKLLDLDALLEHRDFAEAREVAHAAEEHGRDLSAQLRSSSVQFGQNPSGAMKRSSKASERSTENTREVSKMLDKLFPDPREVLPPEQVAQMRRIRGKQGELRQKAQELGRRMDELSAELPLFGGEPRGNLREAEQEMGAAMGAMGRRELPGASGHKRRASDQLKQLRQSLERASQGGQGGLPLPLGTPGGGNGRKGGRGNRVENVEIPPTDPNRAGPQFRKELLEAAKQKPPQRYEDAVRRYYEELIR